ncbi:response regulator [Desulfolithobacter sp.]
MTGKKILIVEDDGIIALLLGEITTRNGYEVVAMVATGRDAVTRAQTEKPDLILMDINLAGDMDGIEAATIIRAHLNVPVVFLTAYADHATLERAKKTGPCSYVLKPVTEEDLINTIEQALNILH